MVMNNVLLIDASPLFREFLKDKLSAEKVSVTVTQGKRDAFIKMISILPDLIIYEIEDDFIELFRFLEKKRSNPNAVRIPMIVSGPVADRAKLSQFAQFGVTKYFNKPIKFDIFFEAVGQILSLAFSMDTTPCMLDIHRNGDIIFIEIAEGLNREKLALLKYKLIEMIDTGKLTDPKIILMMTNLELSFIDGSNIEMLFDNILAAPKVLTKNIKVLSFNSFTRELISGHPEYDGIEVVTELSHVLNSLIDSSAASSVSELVAEKILTPSEEQICGSVDTRFYSDLGVNQDDTTTIGNVLRVALVDDDSIILKILEDAFKAVSATCDLYSSGAEFLTGINKHRYDLAVVDILMPGISGFDILARLGSSANNIPVIIYSQTTKREDVIRALSLGAKHYLVKPQKPEVIVQKAIELLHGKI